MRREMEDVSFKSSGQSSSERSRRHGNSHMFPRNVKKATTVNDFGLDEDNFGEGQFQRG